MRVLIVDDEPLARSHLARLCEEQTDLDVVAQAESGEAAIEAIHVHRPDVVLLDVELQDMSGFDVLRSLDARGEPLAIMVTAYPEHGLEAFEADVIDYLTKPVDVCRFGAAIDRARRRRSGGPGSDMWHEIVSKVRATFGDRKEASDLPRQLVGEKARRMHFIAVETIEYIESEGNYVTIHTGEERFISRNSLKHLAWALAPIGFLRIGRSTLLNLRRVAYAERVGHGVFAFTLHSHRCLVSNASYRKRILTEIRRGQLGGLKEPD